MYNFIRLVSHILDVRLVFHQQSCSFGSSRHCSLSASCHCWPVPACSRPPGTCPSPHSQSEPHQQLASKSEPSAGRCLHQPRGGQPEHENERAGRARSGGRGGCGARLVGLVVLCCEIRHSGHDRVPQLQPESISAGDEYSPPHVPVSPVCYPPLKQLFTFYTPCIYSTNHLCSSCLVTYLSNQISYGLFKEASWHVQ